MTNYAFSLSSSTYKNHILEGLARLQQSDEFVNMTLAAEGHWVKVHQTVVALASPYFRELLQSLPCKHPVIYLYGVSHEALGFILEYLYTGQVEIPAEKVQSFLNIAKDMQIAGLKNIVLPDENETKNQETQIKRIYHTAGQPAPPTTINSTTDNKNISDLQIQAPTIVIPLVGNENKEQDLSPFSVNVPTSSEGSNACHNSRFINASSKMINITFDELAATSNDIIQNPGNNEFQNTTNISEQVETINITVNDSTATNDNISLLPVSDAFQNLKNANAPEKIINVNSVDCTEINDNISNHCLPRTNEVQNVSHINGPGKMINITWDETASDENISQKPFAKIEILSNTLINSNTGVNMAGQGQLPQLYTEPLTNLSKNIPIDKIASNSQIDISKLLDFRDVPMDEDNTPDLAETPAQSRNIEEILDMIHTGNRAEIDEMVQQDRDTDSILYTVSNRGALQLITNRFIYYCHYKRDNGRKRRWRCIDYRDAKCLAAIDTIGEEIVERKHKHCHPNHEEKIKRKIARQNVQVFSTIQMAQNLDKQISKK